MIFSDGRLARIGGDTRARYAYCQEFLLPSLLYAADRLGDSEALALVPEQVELMRREYEGNGDGSFYGNRLDSMKQWSPYYYCRLESDRANALGQLLTYMDQMEVPLATANPGAGALDVRTEAPWCNHHHGAVLHRCPNAPGQLQLACRRDRAGTLRAAGSGR